MRKQGEDVDLRSRYLQNAPHTKKNKRGQCPQTRDTAVTPLNEEKGRAECRRLVGKNGGM